MPSTVEVPTTVISTVQGAGSTVTTTRVSTAEADQWWLPDSWDYETDVCIVGYGGAGMIAAVHAYDAGANVLILEKAPVRGGGNSGFNMGQFTCPDDVDAAATYVYKSCNGTTPMDVCQAWGEEAVKNYDDAVEYGLDCELGETARSEYDFIEGCDHMFVVQGTGYGMAFYERL